MQFDELSRHERGEAESIRLELRSFPPCVLYALAASRAARTSGWRDRGAALLLEAAADEQVRA